MDGDVRGQHALQTVLERYGRRHAHVPDAAAQRFLADVEMADLMRGMHARVGAAGDGQAQRLVIIAFRYTKNGMQHSFDFSLHGTHVRLFRPSVEIGAVICQVDT